MDIIVVENFQKKLTLEGIFDGEYIFLSSGGNISKVKNSDGSWQLSDKSKEIIEKIKSLASSQKSKIYLAMDDDDQGEKIAWDLMGYLKEFADIYRVTIRKLAKEAIKEAISSARMIDKKKVEAYKVKRQIDYLISHDIANAMRRWFVEEEIFDSVTASTIKIGRISAAALALIMEAEEKIDTFVSVPYNRVAVEYTVNGVTFRAKNKHRYSDEQKEELLALVNIAENEPNVVSRFDRGTKDRPPPSALNSFLLQRAANYQFQMSSKEVMKIAKELYEGVTIRGKRVGLITYYKSQSTYVADDNLSKIVDLVNRYYGDAYTFISRRGKFTDEDKKSEAIIPTNFSKEFFPSALLPFLTEKQFLVYRYIFLRTMATQMVSATFDQSEIIIDAGGNLFKAKANGMLFDGWMKTGNWWKNDDTTEEELVVLPENVVIGEILEKKSVSTYKVNPPSPWRYGEGRFITTLQKHGITDAGAVSEIVSFLKNNGLIFIRKGMLNPTLAGKKVYYFLKRYAPWLVDLDLTEELSKKLTQCEIGGDDPKKILNKYKDFVERSLEELGYKEATKEHKAVKEIESQKEILGSCPSCDIGKIYFSQGGYYCTNHNCSFKIENERVEAFFNYFGKNISKDVTNSYLSIILKKGECTVKDMFDPKKEDFFDGVISVKYDGRYDRWGFYKKEGEK